MKAILRQDPDIILIGEIRDAETAEIALRASITGHLVLTSLHTNNAIGTVLRLINMGLERHLVANALTGSIAQRLVPRICDGCRTAYKLEARALDRICANCGINPKLFLGTPGEGDVHFLSSDDKAPDEFTFHRGAGCTRCAGTGYHGRIGTFEIAQFSEEIREAIIKGATLTDIENAAVKAGFRSIVLDAIQKAKMGIVTLNDIYPILLEKST